jgi:CheY-like chemotaxis protein
MGNPTSQSVAVLVVEDEHLIRMDTASFLEAAGFKVFDAANAADAIRSLERAGVGRGRLRRLPGGAEGIRTAMLRMMAPRYPRPSYAGACESNSGPCSAADRRRYRPIAIRRTRPGAATSSALALYLWYA